MCLRIMRSRSYWSNTATLEFIPAAENGAVHLVKGTNSIPGDTFRSQMGKVPHQESGAGFNIGMLRKTHSGWVPEQECGDKKLILQQCISLLDACGGNSNFMRLVPIAAGGGSTNHVRE